MTRRRRSPLLRTLLRALLGAVGVIAAVAVLGGLAAMLLIDPNHFKPDIEAAFRRATGRELALRGPMRISYSLPPALIAEEIALLALPGGTRAELATVQRLTARVALLPLLGGQVDLVELDLLRPDILLEVDAAGHGNWLQPAREPAAPPATAATSVQDTAPRERFALQALHIRDGHVAWHDGRTGRRDELSLPRLDAEGSSPQSSLVISGEAEAGGRRLALSGETGSIARLLDKSATTPWLVQVIAQNDAMRLAANGSVLQPLKGSGYALQLDATATDLAAIAPFLPPGLVPPHDLSVSAHVADAGGGPPAVSAITVHVGELHVPLPVGVQIVRADVTTAGVDQPLHADVQATYRGSAVHLVADGASLAALRPGTTPGAPVPLTLALEALGASLTATGTAAVQPLGQGEVDLALTAHVADLTALAPLAGRPLPRLRQIALDGHLSGNLAGALTLRKARLTLPQAQLTADLDLARTPRPSVRGTIQASRVDLDALLVALAPAGEPAPLPSPPAAPAPALAAKPDKPARLIPDEPFDLSALDRLDADLQVAISALQTGGVTYSDVAAHGVLQSGRLTVDPFAGQLPGGRLEARLAIDPHAADAPMAVALHAPSLALQPIAAAFGTPHALAGMAWFDVDLHGNGRTPRAVAASLDGHVGVALVDGEMDNATLALLLGAVLKTAKFPESVLAMAGGAKLRCLAVRLDASHGAVAVPVLMADATRLLVQGNGALDLGQEMLNLHLRPLLRLGPGIMVPVRIAGSFREPKFASDPGGAKGGLLGALAAIGNGDHGPDACVPALAAVRGPDAPSLAPASLPAPAKPPKAADLLRGLLQ